MHLTENCLHSSLYKKVTIPIRIGLLCFVLGGLFGCGSVEHGINAIGTNITPIRSLQPPQEDNTTVYIQGRVDKQVPLLKRRAYQINDSTGKIWVITNQHNWKQGDKVVVKGKIKHQSIALAGKEYGEVYLEEE